MDKKKLTGTSLVGGTKNRERVENDYYATPRSSVIGIINNHTFQDGLIWEPACGQGHIIKVLKEFLPNKIIGSDLVDREKICDFHFKTLDFLNDSHVFKNKPTTIITNPPFKYSQDFIEKSLDYVTDNGHVIMFAKIQLLEGVKRKKMFENIPPKYIYVFSGRQNPLRNGEEFDENGKKWSNTMCFAWFMWEKGFKGEPIIRWI